MDEATRKRYLQLPMPPSWEVKYDFSSRRYFYIDHNTKQTTWEDPRPDYYAKLERHQLEQQQQHQQQQQRQQQHYRNTHSYLSSHAVASFGNRSPATSPRRPETIALQQMAESPRSRPSSTRVRTRNSSQSDTESNFMQLPTDQDFELAVLQSKFPNKPKEMLQAALKMSNGNVTLATMRIRQGDSSQVDEDRDLSGKCRSLLSDFPDMSQETVMKVLKENDGNMYRSKERLKKIRAEKSQQDSPQVSMAAKVRTLTAKFNSIEPNIIREMLEECNGDMAEVSRKLTVITGDTAASASPGSAACHPSPQPRSVVEGTNSLDRQQRHRMLVSELAAEFPAVERAVVRRTLASTGWKMAESRQKLKEQLTGTSQSPRPTTAQSSGSSGSGHSLPSAPQPVQKPKAMSAKGKERKHKSKKAKDSKKKHRPKEKNTAAQEKSTEKKEALRSSLAVGPNPELVKGPGGLANGPDPKLRSGPQSELAKGPAGLAVGRNTSLACGADPFLPKGSMTRSYQTVLVL